MKKIIRLASSGVGLAAEAIEDRKKRKAAASSVQPVPESSDTLQHHDEESDSDNSSIEADDDVWELDEALDPPTYEESQAAASSSQQPKDETGDKDHPEKDGELEPKESEKKKPDIASLVRMLVAKCPPPPAMVAGGPLPCPVILPQRRPGAKGRGFVRAYAPVLAQAGIDQDTFLGFLNGWDDASKVSYISRYNGQSSLSIDRTFSSPAIKSCMLLTTEPGLYLDKRSLPHCWCCWILPRPDCHGRDDSGSGRRGHGTGAPDPPKVEQLSG
jgi:hypothetical protein